MVIPSGTGTRQQMPQDDLPTPSPSSSGVGGAGNQGSIASITNEPTPVGHGGLPLDTTTSNQGTTRFPTTESR